MNAANRVALNTGILYGRMLITMGITLYSTRLVLNALGSIDYGIFNLLAGIILMLSFLNTAMATSTQRYLSYHQGKKDLVMQKKIFQSSVLLHVFIGLSVILGLEIIGLFLFNGFLNIPIERISSAKIIYHFISLSVFFTIASVPFNGSLIAHENMFWVALVNIVETLLKLGIALFLFIAGGDKLIVYGTLTASIAVVSFTLCTVYCLKKYPECSLKDFAKPEKGIIKELGSFAGWNLFGALCGLGRTQGIAVMLNIFFGTIVNAAYGIANQISSQLNFFSATMLRALNPQIMKSEGVGDRERMLRLSMMASKFGFFLLAFFAVPCIFEMPMILKFWLHEVPNYTVTFCQLILIGGLAGQLTIGIQSAMQATGEIQIYQLVVGSLLILNLPLGFFLLKIGMPAYSVMVSYVIIELIAGGMRLFFCRKQAGLRLTEYFDNVFKHELIPVITSCLVCWLCVKYINIQYRFLLTGILSAISFCLMVYFTGLLDSEKIMINNLIRKIKQKIIKRKFQT